MDYEKMYKEALSRAREIHRNEDDKRSTMEFLFSELKECEDERIKSLIYCLIRDRSYNGKILEHNGCSVEKALAWLEKQGEQKPSAKDTIDIDKMVEEWKQNTRFYSTSDVLAYRQGLNDAVGKIVLKPAWSEEDERMCNASIRACQYMVEHFENSTRDYEDSIDWLKSLKDRMKGE